jgi:hypothetical protein
MLCQGYAALLVSAKKQYVKHYILDAPDIPVINNGICVRPLQSVAFHASLLGSAWTLKILSGSSFWLHSAAPRILGNESQYVSGLKFNGWTNSKH